MSKILCCKNSEVENKDLNLYVSLKLSKLLHLYNTECSEYKKKNEPKVLYIILSTVKLSTYIIKYVSTQ